MKILTPPKPTNDQGWGWKFNPTYTIIPKSAEYITKSDLTSTLRVDKAQEMIKVEGEHFAPHPQTTTQFSGKSAKNLTQLNLTQTFLDEGAEQNH